MDRTITNSSRPEVIDIIVVAYRNDIFLLELQAKSISLYFPHDRIGNIYICVNDEDHYCNNIDVEWWRENKTKVKIIPRSFFGLASNLDGWSSQQLYKLLLAEQVESSWSMCLDSKTCFVQQLDWEKWFDSSGRVNVRHFPTIKVFYSAQVFVENYFKISCPKVIGPGGVPFMFHTATVKSMVSKIPDFFNFFCNNVFPPNALTEFMLYTGFVIYKYSSFDKLYSDCQYYSVFNLADHQVEDFAQVWQLTNRVDLLTASVQERAYPHLSNEQFDIWIDFLQQKKLLTKDDAITKKLNTLR